MANTATSRMPTKLTPTVEFTVDWFRWDILGKHSTTSQSKTFYVREVECNRKKMSILIQYNITADQMCDTSLMGLQVHREAWCMWFYRHLLPVISFFVSTIETELKAKGWMSVHLFFSWNLANWLTKGVIVDIAIVQYMTVYCALGRIVYIRFRQLVQLRNVHKPSRLVVGQWWPTGKREKQIIT